MKKAFSAVLVLLMLSTPIMSLAKINAHSFDRQKSVIVVHDSVSDQTQVKPAIPEKERIIELSPNSRVAFSFVLTGINLERLMGEKAKKFPYVFIANIHIYCFSDAESIEPNEMIFVIGNKRYSFLLRNIKQGYGSISQILDSSYYLDYGSTALSSKAYDLLNDIEANKESEILVRLVGKNTSYDFTLPEKQKESIASFAQAITSALGKKWLKDYASIIDVVTEEPGSFVNVY